MVEFYLYLYHTSPFLFFSTLFTNWLLPIVLEALPWYLSRRALSKLLRDSRNAIQHRLISADPFPPSSLVAFAAMSLMYSLLHTVEELLRSRLLLLNRLVIRRLVMERILYSEVGSLQLRYAAVIGGEKAVVRTEQLEVLVFNDINETLQLFNSTIPHLFRSTYTLLLSTSDLWQQRSAIDVLSILRPSIVGFSSELLNLLRDRLVLDPQSVALQRVANEQSTFIANLVDGLSEVQVNNMQQWAMDRLQRLSEEEVKGKQGWATLMGSVYRVAQGRGVLDFVSEVYVVKSVMERRGISHEEYSKVQNDIDYVSRLVGRIYGLMREAWRILDTQQRVMAVLHLPSFIHEQGNHPHHSGSSRGRRRGRRHRTARKQPPLPIAPGEVSEEFDFHDLTVRRLWFRYASDQPWALKIGQPPDGVDDSDDAQDEAKDRDRVEERSGHNEEPSAQEGEETSLRSPSSSSSRPPPALRFERGRSYAIIGQNRSGKCWARRTRLRLTNGDTVAVEDVVAGAQLMGDDGLPRIVTPGSLTQGVGPLYRITPKWDGARPFTVNGDHILVLINHVQPFLVERSGPDAGWKVVEWRLTTDNRMVERSRAFRTKARAEAELNAIFATGWAPLQWEVSVEEFLRLSPTKRRICMLMACKAITFTNPLLPSLYQVLTQALDDAPSTAQLEWMAWWLGMWLTDGVSDRPSISQRRAPPPHPPTSSRSPLASAHTSSCSDSSSPR